MSSMPFSQRLVAATEAGLLIAAKYGLVAVIWGLLVWFSASDYLSVRRASKEGCGAYAFLAQSIIAQRDKTPPPQALARCE